MKLFVGKAKNIDRIGGATSGIVELRTEATCGSPLPSLPAFPSFLTQITCLKSIGLWFLLLK